VYGTFCLRIASQSGEERTRCFISDGWKSWLARNVDGWRSPACESALTDLTLFACLRRPMD